MAARHRNVAVGEVASRRAELVLQGSLQSRAGQLPPAATV